MTNKLLLLGIAVAAAGMVALPQTLALFSGQHNFYDVLTNSVYNGKNTVIPCQKCHADVYAEFNQPSDQGGVNALNAAHLSVEGCQGCHMTDGPAPNFNGDPNSSYWTTYQKTQAAAGGNVTFHAAAAPACLACHSGDPGDETNGARNATLILTGSEEVHKPFANGALSSPLLKDANEACVACHTHVAVNISWTKAYMLTFSAAENVNSSGYHNWTVSSFNTSGTVNVTTYGNQTGANTSASGLTANWANGQPVSNP